MRNALRTAPIALLLLVLSAGTVPAQEAEDDYDDGLFGYTASIEAWVAQPTGLDYAPANVLDPTNPFFERVLRPEHSTTDEFRFSFGLHFRGDAGSVVYSYYEHEDADVTLGEFAPGNYVYTTNYATPLFAGFNNDGLSDGFDSQFRTVLRDMRIAYKRKAFSSNRVEADWWAGVRRVKHNREIDASYFAIVDTLPPLIPPLVSDPRPDLDPLPDLASSDSRYRGRGLEVGMEFRTRMLDDKLTVTASIGASFLRGEIRHTYSSRTSYYRFQDPITAEQTILDPPYELFDDIIQINTSGQTGPAVNFISQIQNLDRFIDENRSTSGIALDTELSVGYRVHKWVEIYVGFRGSSFENVGIDSRRTLTQVGSSLVEGISTRETSAVYEGFFGGVRFHY